MLDTAMASPPKYDLELEVEASDIISDSDNEAKGGTWHVMQPCVPIVVSIASFSMTLNKQEMD